MIDTVLKRARVAFVRVADHVLEVAWRLAAYFPFDTGRKAGAATSPQSGALDLGDDVVRRHFRKRFDERLVSADGDVIVDLVLIDIAALLQQEPLLLAVEGDVVLVNHSRVCPLVLIQQALDVLVLP